MVNPSLATGFPVDVNKLIESRLLVTANSGGGKSWALRRLLEQTHGHVQQIVLDPEDEFYTLRAKYDYVLAGRAGGDCPADLRSASLLATRLLELQTSAIIGIYELKAHERIEFVRRFLEALINAPKNLWHPCLIVIDEAHVFCLDEETEILTASNGFKRWNEVRVGDAVITYSPERQEYGTGPIERILTRNHSGSMVRAVSDGVDALMTHDHRAVIQRTQRGQGRYQVYPPSFCPAGKLPSSFYIPIGGAPPSAGLDLVTLDECKLLGWIITDGHYTGGASKKYLAIEQAYSTVKRGVRMVDQLATLLGRFPGVTRHERGARTTYGMGREKQHSPSATFYLRRPLSERMLTLLDNGIHRIPRSLLAHGSHDQLSNLFEGLFEGDGTAKGDVWRAFYAGKNEGLADDVQELCLRLGVNSVKKFVRQNGQFIVLLSARKAHYIRRVKEEQYTGIVWDVTVPDGAFIARRRGKVFVTGNCPESSRAESRQAVIDLMTRGRKRGFCGVLATQRYAQLAKDASAQANNKLIGRFSQDVDVKRAAEDLGFYKRDDQAALRFLKPGTFYATGPALSATEVKLVTVGPVTTEHPRAGQGLTLAPPPAAKVKAILAQLADLPAEAEEQARTVEDLRKEITQLKRQLTQQPKPVDEAEIRKAGFATGWEAGMANAWGAVKSAFEGLAKSEKPFQAHEVPVKPTSKPEPKPVVLRPVAVQPKATAMASGTCNLGKAERAILTALAPFPEGCTRRKTALMAQYSVTSGSFRNTLSSLRTQGYLDGSDPIRATEAGLSALGSYEPLPTGHALLRHWMSNSILGKCAREILGALAQAGGRMTREEIAAATGYSAASGSFRNSLSELRTLELIDRGDPIQLAEDLL